ncbi:3-hydroxyacyl-CoA dehydrogenase type-2, partial [Stegodyphus mimosarum]
MGSPIKVVKGLVALVTGGASGLGEATVRRLVQNGASVLICDLPSSNGQKVAKELGEKCVYAPTDVTKEKDVQEALKITKVKFHKLDVVVNCAGTAMLKPIYNFKEGVPHSLEDFMKVVTTNTLGVFNVTRLAVGLIAKNQPDEDGQKGVIINTSSVAAFDGHQGLVAHSASKAAIVGMTLPLARDLANEGIRCCTIVPGLFDTQLFKIIPEEDRQETISDIPFPNRLGKPEEFAHLVQAAIENPMLNG